MTRQLVLMKQQDQVSAHLSVRDMKKWLLSGGGFLDEFQEIIERTEIQYLFVAELAWTTARHLCLRLFTAVQQGGHTGGFQMFVSVFCPEARENPSFHPCTASC